MLQDRSQPGEFLSAQHFFFFLILCKINPHTFLISPQPLTQFQLCALLASHSDKHFPHTHPCIILGAPPPCAAAQGVILGITWSGNLNRALGSSKTAASYLPTKTALWESPLLRLALTTQSLEQVGIMTQEQMFEQGVHTGCLQRGSHLLAPSGRVTEDNGWIK